MDINRAKEISVSPVMEDVEYNGVPVYIQHVDETLETARIYPLDDPDQEIVVPVRSITEPSSEMAMEVEQMSCRVLGGGVDKFSETNEFNHDRNEVAQAQKQMASQETTGVRDQQ